jgi:hypothetical protein
MKIPKNAISGEEQPFLECCNRILALIIIRNCVVYWEFVRKKQIRPNCVLKWCERYGIEVENWKIIFRFYASIKDSRLKAFQYKVLNSLIPCNLYLSKIGRSNSNTCAECNDLDDMMHYFFNCPTSKHIWRQLSTWWQGLVGQVITITERDVILGLAPRQDKVIMEEQLNHIILNVKWKIYSRKESGESIGWYHILISIRNMIETLGFIAGKNGTTDKHDRFWGEIIDYLT